MGAGFAIAMRDLELRGAGNILGTQQSGHIATVGYELYCELLEQAVRKLKQLPPKVTVDVNIDLPGEAYLPRSVRARHAAEDRPVPPAGPAGDDRRNGTTWPPSWSIASARGRRRSIACCCWPGCGSGPTAGRSSRSTWRKASSCSAIAIAAGSSNWPKRAAAGCGSSMTAAPICRWPRTLAESDQLIEVVQSLLRPQ